MSICKECGSEVTTVDQFCPFCGIRMETEAETPAAAPEQAAAAPAESEAEMDSTIVISPDELDQMRRDAASGASAGAGSSAPRDTSPTVKTDPQAIFDDAPAPAILTGSNVRTTDPGVVFAKEANSDLVPTRDDVGKRLAAEGGHGATKDDLGKAVAAESASVEPVSVEPIAPAEPETAEEPVKAPAEQAAKEAAPLAVETEAEAEKGPDWESVDTKEQPAAEYEEAAPPETPPTAVEAVPESPALESLKTPEEPQLTSAVTEEPELVQAQGAEPAEGGIVMPAEILETPEKPPSVFDSVRIIEEEIPERLAKMEAEKPAPPAVGDEGETVIPGRTPGVSSRSLRREAGVTGASLGGDESDAKKINKLKPLPEGAVLNARYEVVRKIGGGGMGAVYLASDNNLGGVLRAVKEMIQSHIEEEQQEKAINDFKRESMILSSLDHPSIPTIFDYFCEAEAGRFYLVMKYISGGDLSAKLRAAPEGKLDELTVTEWAIQITDVLNYLHNQPTTIVYRDLKPSNLMLDGNSSRVMLIDFGIARSISQREEKGVTAVGTMGYAPPELFSGNVEPRSDIYSLGSTMFHLLTGADPQSNPLLIFDFQKNPRPRQINSRLSDQMERILMKAVEYNADGRYSSAAEMKAVLEDHLNNLRTGNLSFGVTEAPVSVSLANQSVFCGFCGQRIVATDMFCAFCGAKQPLAQQGVHSEIYHKAALTARLVIEGTSDLTAPTYALQKDDNLIGRRDPMSNIFPEVDLSKFDPQTKISRRHAKIWRDGTSYMLEDLGSSNGTIIEGSATPLFRLPAHQPYKLSSGDRIRIGDTRLHFVVG